MSLRVRARRVFPSLFVCAWCGVVAAATDAPAQDRGTSPPAPEARVSIVYTGRSLGALGVLRDSDENDLLIEEAARRKLPVRLATYACWRAPNITVFSRARGAPVLLVDLGHRDGDLGLERSDRARVDYTALTRLGYQIVVPYEFELALGAAALASVKCEFPAIRFLAANVKPAGDHRDLFEG